MAGADTGLAASALGDALAGTGHAAVEVHAVDADRWVVPVTLTLALIQRHL